MSTAPVYVSAEGLQKMKDELHYLKTVKRREVAARIEAAKELGDLRENADYTEAKDQLAFTEGRIIELEDMSHRAVVIEATGASDSVMIGSTVKVKFDDKEKVLTIVGSQEADPVNGKISNESPLGMAFLGRKVGEVVEVKVPAGLVKYSIVSIS